MRQRPDLAPKLWRQQWKKIEAEETETRNQLVGLAGLLLLAAITAIEAGLAVKRVRNGA